MSGELSVSKQQFVDIMFQRFKHSCQPPLDYHTQKTVREGLELEFRDIETAGFVLVDRKVLFGQFSTGSPKAHLKNELIKSILGEKEK